MVNENQSGIKKSVSDLQQLPKMDMQTMPVSPKEQSDQSTPSTPIPSQLEEVLDKRAQDCEFKILVAYASYDSKTKTYLNPVKAVVLKKGIVAAHPLSEVTGEEIEDAVGILKDYLIEGGLTVKVQKYLTQA